MKKNRHLVTWVEHNSCVIELGPEEDLQVVIQETIVNRQPSYWVTDKIEVTGDHSLNHHAEVHAVKNMVEDPSSIPDMNKSARMRSV